MSEAEVTHPHHGIDYIEIPTRDMAASQAFYSAAFEWRFNDYGPGYAGYVDGARGDLEAGGLALVDSVVPGGALVILYSRDLEATFAAVREAGATITKEIFAFPGGRRFQFEDPSGIELAVWGS